MKKILPILLAVLVLLAACQSDKNEEKPSEKAAAESVRQSGAAPSSGVAEGNPSATSGKPGGQAASTAAPDAAPETATPPPSPEELERADRLVAFSNAASSALASGRYAQADVLMAYTKYYLAEWQLAKRPALNPEQDDILARRLIPPTGLLTPEQTQTLAASVKTMDKAFGSMRADYRSLERYVADASIQDDGVKGKSLATSIAKAYASFIEARDAYMGILDAEAGPAENMLLRNHPLKRQILAAGHIFAVFGKTAQLLAPDNPDRAALQAQRRKLADALADGGRPPFMASPDLERRYRAFLKAATRYATGFDKGLEEEFYASLRLEMNNAALESRAAYNDFVRDANQLR